MPAWREFREDLRGAHDDVVRLQCELEAYGYVMAPVRILEVLIWMEVGAGSLLPARLERVSAGSTTLRLRVRP